ncbi:hypothetical protein ES703_99176 [subsurface metagenome]
MESYCQSQGWKVIQEYVDAGFTGKDGDRPKLKHLLADAKLGLFNKVIVYKMDRLARNLRLLLEIEDKLKENSISFHSIKEVFDTSTASGRHFLQMLGMISEWEREAIIERTKAGRLQRYKQGCWGPGNPPYGYKYHRETKKLIVDKTNDKIIKRIFEEYSAGKSMTYIANVLNYEKIPPRNPKKGKGWRNGSIRDVLFNPVYKGTQIVNVYQDYSRLPREIPENAIIIEVPAIVSESLWDIAQERRKNNKHLKSPRDGHWLLQGLITCGLCGYTFRTEVTHKRRQYGCRGRLKYTHIDGSPRCMSPRLDAELLEEQVWQKIEAIINDPNKLEELLKETIDNLKNREADLDARIQPIEKRLAQISEQKARLADEWVQLNMDTDKHQNLKQKLEQEEARLMLVKAENDPDQLEELEHTQSMLQFWEGQLKAMVWNTENEDGSMVRVVDKPHKTALKIIGFEDKDITGIMHFPATRRELLDMLQVRIVVFMDRAEIKAVFPIEPIECQSCLPDYR